MGYHLRSVRNDSPLIYEFVLMLFCFTLLFDFTCIDQTWSSSLLGKRDFVWVHFDLPLLMDRGYQYVAGDVFNIMAVKK